MLHYTVHVTPLCALGRTTSSVTDVRLTSRFSQKSKDKTERCCKDQYKPKPIPRYRIAKVHNCIPRSHIVYIDTTGFLFVVR